MTFPYPASSRFKTLSPALGPALLAAACLFSACAAPAPAGGASASAIAVSEDESADALRLAQEARLELQTQSARLKELEGQVRDLTEILSWTSERLQAQGRSLDSLQQGLRPVPAARPPSSPVPAAAAAATPPRITSDEASRYREALDQYFGHNYAAALKAFAALQARYPQGAYADNAEYWIGESRFAQGDYTGALASFRKVFTYAGTEKADDAQLKIGYCQLRLNDRKKAEEEFRKLVSLYPSSEYVDRAQGELDKLGDKPGEKPKPE